MAIEPVRRHCRELSHAGRVPRKLWNRLPIADDVFEVTLPAGQRFRYRAGDGDAIGQALYWRGLNGWESATIYTFLPLAVHAHRFLDVGANTGAYTLLACTINPELSAVAYEPVPRVHALLRDNIELNQLGERCRAEQCAVSDRQGTTSFHIPDTKTPSSASMNQVGFRNISGQLHEVPVTTLDADTNQAPRPEQKIDLIKIDVEGFEHTVLNGMPRLLAEDRPLIICECNPDGPYQEIETILSDAGYRFFHLRDDGPHSVPALVPDPLEQFRNFACVPKEDDATIQLLARLSTAPHK